MVNEVKPEFAGTYTCRAENIAGSVTSTASVNVLETPWEETVELVSPTFVKKLTPVIVTEKEDIKLTCIVQGKPTPRVQWYHDNKVVQEGKQITIIQDQEGVCSLAISKAIPLNAGEYTCEALNPVGKAVCTASVVVEGNENIF